jgi:hypothetical protein
VAEGAKPPTARGGHTSVLVEKNLIVQGGTQHKSAGVFEYFSLNPHVLDTETHTWFQPRVALGKGATPRAYHTATRIKTGLFIFGGSTAKKAGESGLLGDLVIFDLQRMAWESKDVRGKKPRARFMHSAELCEGKLIVYGGSDGTKSLSDVSVLDVSTMLWSAPICAGEPPRGLQSHSCTLVGDRLFMVGGMSVTLNDAEQSFINYSNDVYTLDTTSMTWTRLPQRGELPKASHATPRHDAPRRDTPRRDTPPRHVTPRHATPRHATSRHVTHSLARPCARTHAARAARLAVARAAARAPCAISPGALLLTDVSPATCVRRARITRRPSSAPSSCSWAAGRANVRTSPRSRPSTSMAWAHGPPSLCPASRPSACTDTRRRSSDPTVRHAPPSTVTHRHTPPHTATHRHTASHRLTPPRTASHRLAPPRTAASRHCHAPPCASAPPRGDSPRTPPWRAAHISLSGTHDRSPSAVLIFGGWDGVSPLSAVNVLDTTKL